MDLMLMDNCASGPWPQCSTFLSVWCLMKFIFSDIFWLICSCPVGFLPLFWIHTLQNSQDGWSYSCSACNGGFLPGCSLAPNSRHLFLCVFRTVITSKCSWLFFPNSRKISLALKWFPCLFPYSLRLPGDRWEEDQGVPEESTGPGCPEGALRQCQQGSTNLTSECNFGE